MGEEPLTSSTLVSTLAQFHREIVMPEFRREMDALRTDIRAEFAGRCTSSSSDSRSSITPCR